MTAAKSAKPTTAFSLPAASTYRFVSTDTLTGQVLCSDIPLTAQSASRQVNSVGAFSGALTLRSDTTAAMRQVYTTALQPWRSILWVLQDGQPIWHGPITGWPHGSLSGGNLPIQAATIEEFFKHRQITDNLTYTNMDIFEIFRQELLYAVGKPGGRIAGSGQYINQSGIIDTVTYSGVVGSITESATLKYIYDAWSDLIQTYSLEYALSPGVTAAGSLFTQVQMGLPQMGRTQAQTNFQLVIPSYHMMDYGWQWTPTNPVNSLVVTGSGETNSFTAKAVSQFELSQGYPLLEGNTSYSGTVSSQDQINAFAQGSLYPLTVLGNLTPVVFGGEGSLPRVRDVLLGDEVYFVGTSPLHPAGPYGTPGVAQKFQITGWTLTFPNGQQPEQITWQLGPIQEGIIQI